MHIDVTHRRTPQYFRGLLREHAKGTAQRTVALSVLFAVFGVLSIVLARGRNAGTLFGILGLCVAVVVVIGARHRYLDAVRVPESWCGPRRWVVTEDWVEASTELTLSRLHWSAVRRVALLPEAYALWQDGGAVFDIPRAALTPEHDVELRSFLAGRGLLRPL